MFNARIPAILNPLFGRKSKVKRDKVKIEFTQAELQQLQSILKEQSRYCTAVVGLLKSESSEIWNHCNKNDPSTLESFKMFSQVNRERKRKSQELRKVESLQTKLKRILRS